MKLFKEEDTEDLQDIGDKMKPGDDTRTVAYASYLQFLSKLEKTQNYRIVGKFVKQKYAQAKGTNDKQAKKLKEVYYILTYYANMKDEFNDTIGEKSKDIINSYKDKMKGKQFSLLSDVSPYIALATKEKIGDLLSKSGTLLRKIDALGAMNQHIEGFQDKIIDIKRYTPFPSQADFDQYLQDPESNPEVLKNLRIIGIAIAELFGPLMSKPKGYLNYLEKDVFKIKPPDAPTVPDAPARVDLDRPDTADFSRFLSEGLSKANAKEKAKSREVRSEFFKADEENKKAKFFDMIMSLEYNITTKFKIINNKDFEKINDIVEREHGGITLLNLLKDQMLDMFGDAMSDEFRNKYKGEDLKSIDLFRIFLEEAVEEEERIEKDTARNDQLSLQRGFLDEYIEIYKEFKFVAAQKEAGEVDIPNTVRFFFNKSVSYYNASKIEEDNPEKLKYDKAYRMYEYAHTKAEPNWKKVRAKIAQRKLRSIETDVEDLELEAPRELQEKYLKVADPEIKSEDIKLHELEKELDAWEKESLGMTNPEDLEEQLTKILAPYLMERIKNRKPIDNRLINILKPLKGKKRMNK